MAPLVGFVSQLEHIAPKEFRENKMHCVFSLNFVLNLVFVI